MNQAQDFYFKDLDVSCRKCHFLISSRFFIEIEQGKEERLSSSSQPQGQEAATEEFLKIVITFSITAFTQNQLIKN